MMIHNKLDKLFGQAGSILGWGVMLVGIFISILPLNILLLLIGSFMAFPIQEYTSIMIMTNINFTTPTLEYSNLDRGEVCKQ